MDPLSISASIITLLATAEAVVDAIRTVRLVQKASAHLDALNNETSIQTQYETDPNVDFFPVAHSVVHAENAINALQQLVDQHLSRGLKVTEEKGDVGAFGVRRRGFVKMKRVQKIVAQLKDVRLRLSTALTTLGHMQMQSDLPRIHLAIQNISIPSQHPVSHSRKSSTSARKRIGDEISAEDAITKVGAVTDPSITSLQFSMTVTTNSCTRFCPCACHIRRTGQTPTWLHSVFGILFYQFSGTPLLYKRACNLPSCKNTAGVARFEYGFPPWLLATAIRLTATWDDFTGFGGTWALRTPQYIPSHAAAIMNVVKVGENEKSLERSLDAWGIKGWAQQRNGLSLLDKALEYRRWDMCAVLLRRGADLSHRRSDHRTTAQYVWSLVLSSRTNQLPPNLVALLDESESLELLDFSVAHRIVTGLLDASLDEHLRLYPMLAQQADSFGETPLFWAAKVGDNDAATLLIRHGADVNARNRIDATPLHYSCQNNHMAVTKVLLHAGANTNAVDNTRNRTAPITHAAETGNPKLVRLLLRFGADPNAGHFPAMCRAAQYADLESLEAMCDAGANLDKVCPDGGSAVLTAVQWNQASAVHLLIARGARLDLVEFDDDNILDITAWLGSVSIMDMLAEAKIQGLPTDEMHMSRYWERFEKNRNADYIGTRQKAEVERAAFQKLMNSVQHLMVEEPQKEPLPRGKGELEGREDEVLDSFEQLPSYADAARDKKVGV